MKPENVLPPLALPEPTWRNYVDVWLDNTAACQAVLQRFLETVPVKYQEDWVPGQCPQTEAVLYFLERMQTCSSLEFLVNVKALGLSGDAKWHTYIRYPHHRYSRDLEYLWHTILHCRSSFGVTEELPARFMEHERGYRLVQYLDTLVLNPPTLALGPPSLYATCRETVIELASEGEVDAVSTLRYCHRKLPPLPSLLPGAHVHVQDVVAYTWTNLPKLPNMTAVALQVYGTLCWKLVIDSVWNYPKYQAHMCVGILEAKYSQASLMVKGTATMRIIYLPFSNKTHLYMPPCRANTAGCFLFDGTCGLTY